MSVFANKSASLPINKRPYRTFLSHSHVDGDIVREIYDWLQQFVGLSTWFDGEHFPSGLIASELGEAIQQCQSAIIVLSNKSISSRWVEQEWNLCLQEQTAYPDFQVILIRIEDCDPPPFLSIRKWIELRDKLELIPAVQIIEAVHWHETTPATIRQKSVYIASGSHPPEVNFNNFVIAHARNLGFRVVRDSPDQDRFEALRVQKIMQACFGLLAIVPHRGNGKTSPYIERELELARKADFPAFVVADERVEEKALGVYNFPMVKTLFDATPYDESFSDEMSQFMERLTEAPKPAFCFFGSQIKGNLPARSYIQRVIQCVTGIPCVFGDGISGAVVQDRIVELIRDATHCIFDISDDRLNTCIEVGIALGSGAPFDLICSGPSRKPPFMFRHRQVYFYNNSVELVGLLRKLSLPYRRLVQ